MGRHKNKRKTGTCTLCGKVDTITREHVPPKCLFVEPRPTNTITVPLCERCNHSYHLDDEYFRVLISCDLNPSSQQWQLWNKKVVGSSFVRSVGLRHRILNEHEIVQEYAKTHDFYSYNGNPIPQNLIPLIQGFEAKRIVSVIDKIIRCLHYHHFDELLNITYSIEVLPPVPLNQLDLKLPVPTGQVGYNGEFVYWRLDHNNPNQTVWLLSFYQHHSFGVIVTNTQQIACTNHVKGQDK
jgi:hypothetical protein